MRLLSIKLILVFSLLTVSSISFARGDGLCYGRVSGVGEKYNASTGKGFLALRAGPSRSASQIAELFEDDKVEIIKSKKGWLKVSADNGAEGWVSSVYIRSSCK
jgi:hypothetical protein